MFCLFRNIRLSVSVTPSGPLTRVFLNSLTLLTTSVNVLKRSEWEAECDLLDVLQFLNMEIRHDAKVMLGQFVRSLVKCVPSTVKLGMLLQI